MAVRTIATDIKLTGEKEFNDQMKAVNSNLKTLKSDMALVSAEFSENADSTEALTAKQKVLQESVDQQKVKVDALRQMYEKTADASGENSAAADKWKQQLNAATVSLIKSEAELKKNATALEAAKKSEEALASATEDVAAETNQAGGKIEDFAEQVSDSAHDVPELTDALEAAKTETKKLGTAADGANPLLKKLGTAASGTVKGIGSITAAAATASAAVIAAAGAIGTTALTAMVGFAKETAEAAKTASEAGEELSESQQKWLEYSNQLDALDASVASAKGALAGVLLPVLGDLSTEGAAFLNDFTRDMEAAAGDTGAQTQVLSDYIVKGATLIKEKLPEYIESGKELFSGLAEGLSESGPELLDMGLDLMMDLLDQIIQFAPQLADAGMTLVQKLLDGLVERGPDIMSGAVDMVTKIVSGLAKAAPQIIPAAAQLVSQLLTTLVENAPQLLQAGLELVLGIISGIMSGLGDIGNTVEDIIVEILEIFGGADFAKAGKDVIDGIKQGIKDAWNGLVNWFDNLWDSLFGDRDVNVNVNATGTGSVDGSHAGGLDYVPFDGYLAELHRGEMVLTNTEADLYRKGQTGQTQKIFNLTINAQSLSKSDMDMLVDYMNEKLGEDL